MLDERAAFGPLLDAGGAINIFLRQSWGMLALRGAVALLFGIAALAVPGLTLIWLITVFAVFAVAAGAVSIAAAWRHRQHDRGFWLVLLFGVISVLAGVIAYVYPAPTALVLIWIMAANALVTGTLDIAVAMRVAQPRHGRWLLALAGTASILFAVLVFVYPAAGALALVWVIGVYAIVLGVLLLTLSVRARRWSQGGAPFDEPLHLSANSRRSYSHESRG